MASLLTRRLLFVTGKGGVGKTSLTAALGLVAARSGRRTLLVEVGEGSAFARIFQAREVGFDPVAVAENLWVTRCEPSRCLQAFLEGFVKVPRLAKALVSNRVAWRFFEAAPGVLQTVVLERVRDLATGASGHRAAYDLTIVDLPATGHAITFLDTPRTLARLIQVGKLAKQLEDLDAFLSDRERNELTIVSQAEEMPVRETIELWQQAQTSLRVPVRTVLLNRLRQSGLSDDLRAFLASRAAGALEVGSPLRAARRMVLWEAHEQARVEELREEVGATILDVPWLVDATTEGEVVRGLAAALTGPS